MATLFLFILVLLALFVGGLFLPVLWIPAAFVLVAGAVYLWQIVRWGAHGSTGRR